MTIKLPKMLRLVSSVILLICCSLGLQAQRGWEVGLGGGVTYYLGDLNTTLNLQRPGPQAGTFARFNFNDRICAKVGFNYGHIAADDADSKNAFEKERNLSFESNIFDGSFQLEFNFLPYIHGSKNNFFSPYLLAGFSVFNFNPKASFEGKKYALRDLGTEGQFLGEEYFTTTTSLNVGGGVKIDLNYDWSLNLELSLHKPRTDYLDDVSTVYPDKEDVENLRGEIAVELSDRSTALGKEKFNIGTEGFQRGNGRNDDYYIFLQLSLVKYFGDLKCPRVGHNKRN